MVLRSYLAITRIQTMKKLHFIPHCHDFVYKITGRGVGILTNLCNAETLNKIDDKKSLKYQKNKNFSHVKRIKDEEENKRNVKKHLG